MAERRRDAASGTDEEHRSLDLLGRAFIAIWCRSLDRIAGHVPPTQLRVLEIVSDRPGIGVRPLAEEIGSTPSSTSRLCDRLVAADLLSRAVDAADRRQVALRLTAQGDQLLRDLARQRRLDLTAVLDRMTPAEREHLVRGLSAFARYTRGGEPG